MIEGAFKSIRETHIKPRPVTPRSDSLIFSRQVAGQLHLLSTLESLVIKISNSWWTNICKVCVPSTVPCVIVYSYSIADMDLLRELASDSGSNFAESVHLQAYRESVHANCE